MPVSVSFTFGQEDPPFACDAETYSDTDLYGPDGLPTFRPLIIAHRGASGMYPEHTALAYTKAAEQGADLIECDLALTRVKLFKHFNLTLIVYSERIVNLYVPMMPG